MKNTVINIRVPDTLKYDLEVLSNLRGTPISALAREALSEFVQKSETNNADDKNKNRGTRDENLTSIVPIQFEEEDSNVITQNVRENIQIEGFPEFIFWICEHQLYPQIPIDPACSKFIYIIQQLFVHSHPKLSHDILVEFNKIALVLRIDDDHYSKRFSMINFDFQKLLKFMHSLRYKEYNNYLK